MADWLYAGLILLGTTVVLWAVLRTVASRLTALSQRTATPIDDMAAALLREVRWWLLLLLGLYVAAQRLELDPRAETWIRHASVIGLLVQLGILGSRLILLWLDRSREQRLATSQAAITGLVAIGVVGRLFVWVLVGVLALDNLGVDVTALIASLGIGGVAVALAVQNILGDLFASFSIIFDKPFVVGDFLSVGEHMGNVEHVGLKTTRLRSLTGEELVFSNSDLLGSRIRNYGRMRERRIAFEIGVTYSTPRTLLERIPAILRTAIEDQERTRFDRAHFKSFGDSALVFETVYFVSVPDYNVYMDVQQAVNLALHARFEEHGIEFAFPTRTVHLHAADGSPADGEAREPFTA